MYWQKLRAALIILMGSLMTLRAETSSYLDTINALFDMDDRVLAEEARLKKEKAEMQTEEFKGQGKPSNSHDPMRNIPINIHKD